MDAAFHFFWTWVNDTNTSRISRSQFKTWVSVGMVLCCFVLRQLEAPDLHPYVTSETLQELGLVEYKVDTFSSDYDDFVDEVGIELDAHGA